MKKSKTRFYYGWFPALFLLTLFVCLPKTVSALCPAQPQETPAAAASVPQREIVTPRDLPEETPEVQEPEIQKPEFQGPEAQEPAPQTQPPQKPSRLEAESEPADSGDAVPAEELPAIEQSADVLDDFFADTLFIGDSRTVGLCEYSGLTTATFFADVGMSVYQVMNCQVYVSGMGYTTLVGLLTSRTFGKIHLMLGINELGYDFNTTVNTYLALVETIRSLQLEAAIYLGANLPVGKARSDTDNMINNPAIDRFNSAVSDLADGETVFYVDVNPLFDDETGSLCSELSGDGTHVYGSCYPQWVQWLYSAMQTAA